MIDWLLILLLLAGVTLIFKINADDSGIGGKAFVVDGDTIKLDDRIIRLSGIDAPEREQECTRANRAYFCGKSATRHLRKIINGKRLFCKGWQYDIYNRMLAECYLAFATPKQQSVNARMVRDGWALSYGGYSSEERSAKKLARGLWSGQFDIPSNWRQTRGKLNGVDVDIVQTIRNWIRNIIN